MLKDREGQNGSQNGAAGNDISGVDIPWPIWLFFALMFALVPFAEKPEPITAHEGWYIRHQN